MPTIREIVETPFPNEKTYTEYYHKDTQKIIAKLLKFKDELHINDRTINDLRKLQKRLKYSTKKQAYEHKVEVYNSDNIGRYYVKNTPSLQSLPSKIKNTIIDANRYVDFDIVNSAPSIMLNICRIKGWKADFLADYCQNRNKYLKKLIKKCQIPRKDAKRLFITMMFGGDYGNWMKEMYETYEYFTPDNVPEWVGNIYGELNTIMDNAYECDDFKNIKKIVLSKRKLNPDKCFDPKKHKASLLANILFNIENVIIQKVEHYISHSTSYKVDTPSFDGFNLRIKTHPDDNPPTKEELESLMKTVEKLILEEMGLYIDFALKDYDDNYHDKLADLDGDDNTTITLYGKEWNLQELTHGVMNETEAMNKILDIYPHFKICEGTLFMYYEGLWTSEEIYIKSFFTENADYIMKLKYDVGRAEFINSNTSFGTSVVLINNVLTSFHNNKNLIDDNLLNTKSTLTSKGKLLFKNGVLSADKNGFIFRNSFDHNEIFKSRIDDDFRISNDIEKINEIREIFFTRMYQENADYVIRFIACALFGDTLKKALFIIGRTNSGKSVITYLLSNNFTKELIGSFELRKFAHQKYQDGDVKHLNWVVQNAEKRLLISNESFNGKVDVETFKQVCSGGSDEIQGRGLYQSAKTVIPKFMMLCFMNPDKMPTFYGGDDALKTRVEILRMRGGYVANRDEIEDETTDFVMEESSQLFAKYTSQPYRDAMRMLFINAYVECLNNGLGTINIIETDEIEPLNDGLDDIRESLRCAFEYAEGEFLKAKDFNDWVNNEHLNNLRSTNVRAKLMKELYKSFGKPYVYTRMSIDNTQHRGYKNIQFKGC